jgi:hypothetical protein
MKTVQFKDVQINQVFKMNDAEYKKIAEKIKQREEICAGTLGGPHLKMGDLARIMGKCEET